MRSPAIISARLLAFCSMVSACQPSARGPDAAPGTGGIVTTGGSAGLATGGTGGGGASGGSTGGAVGALDGGQSVAVDAAPMSTPGSDGAAPGVDSGPVVLTDPSTWPGGAYMKGFIIACPDGAPREACCAHYCGCMMTNCSKQLPQDCMAACTAPAGVSKWDLKCRVYNCFESLNPLATKDHQAHCEHAGVYTGTQRTRGAGDTHAKCHVAGDPDEP
jgi:hypothetical protein